MAPGRPRLPVLAPGFPVIATMLNMHLPLLTGGRMHAEDFVLSHIWAQVQAERGS